MSEKKRTTVITIETHEVWIIRRPVPELPDERVTIPTLETAQLDTVVLPATEPTNGSETSREQSSLAQTETTTNQFKRTRR
jgi:hypothetical protein